MPGAALGIRHGNDRFECAAGVLNQQTAVAATPDSVFQIGSITKVWTTTLIMGLADEGRLDLDASVQTYLPGFRVADEAASATITVRQLLCHTSGFDGDLFTDTGRGDDALERFVAELSQQQQVFAPGAAWSYNNAAFDVAGRVVEAVTGTTWDQALADRLVGPLGASRTGTLPEQALLHRAAAGHITDPDGTVRLATTWALPRSSGPAGLITASVGDLLDFAWMHLHGGHPEVVSDAARAEMAREQVRLPAPLGASRTWGLGWSRFHWSTTGGDPVIVLGHDGATIGQFAFLRAHNRQFRGRHVPRSAPVSSRLPPPGGSFSGRPRLRRIPLSTRDQHSITKGTENAAMPFLTVSAVSRSSSPAEGSAGPRLTASSVVRAIASSQRTRDAPPSGCPSFVSVPGRPQPAPLPLGRT